MWRLREIMIDVTRSLGLSEPEAQAYAEVVSESDALRVALAKNGIGAIGQLTKAAEGLQLLKALEALFETGI